MNTATIINADGSTSHVNLTEADVAAIVAGAPVVVDLDLDALARDIAKVLGPKLAQAQREAIQKAYTKKVDALVEQVNDLVTEYRAHAKAIKSGLTTIQKSRTNQSNKRRTNK